MHGQVMREDAGLRPGWTQTGEEMSAVIIHRRDFGHHGSPLKGPDGNPWAGNDPSRGDLQPQRSPFFILYGFGSFGRFRVPTTYFALHDPRATVTAP